MTTPILGKECKVYYGAKDAALIALSELLHVKDASPSLEAGEADVTTRSSGGWREKLSSLKDLSADIEIIFHAGDAGYKALRDAYLNGTTLCLALLTGANDEAGAEGPRFNASVSKMDRGEGLEEGVTVKFSVKNAGFLAWEEVSGLSPAAPTVTTLAASNIASTSATAGGNVTDAGSEPVTERGVCFGLTENPTISGSHTHDASGTGTFVSTLTGLTAGTTYHIRAYAKNAVGVSYGADLTFQTLA